MHGYYEGYASDVKLFSRYRPANDVRFDGTGFPQQFMYHRSTAFWPPAVVDSA